MIAASKFSTLAQIHAQVPPVQNPAIDNIAKERGFDYVLDAMTGSILYALPQYDLTEDVLKELKRSTSDR